MPSHWLSPEVVELLDRFLAAAAAIERPYAIGGAVAMGVHGYRRQTDDVDAYVRYEDRVEWVRALRAQGLSVTPLFAGVHYVALGTDIRQKLESISQFFISWCPTATL